MGNVISGKNMAVNAAAGAGIFNFQISAEHFPPWMVGGNQQGGVARGEGNADWTGLFQANGHTPVVWPGDSFTFTCAPTQDGSVAVSGTARCLGWEVIVDNQNPEDPLPIHHTVFFGSNGALSPSQTDPTDTSTPVVYSPKGLCAYFGSSQAHTFYQRFRVFLLGVGTYVDCTSDGVVMRDEGKAIDAEFEWRVYTDDSGDFPLPSAGQVVARQYVTDSTYWQATWMRIAEYPKPWDGNLRGNKPISARFLAKFSGHSGTSAGSILNPAGATKWP